MESKIIGFILLVVGGFLVVRADIFMRFQIWTQRIIMGAKYEPSQRTYKITRFIGVLFVLLGFLAIVGFIE